MSYEIREVSVEEFPPLLREIPQPPKQLYYRGILPAPDRQLLSVVGSRHYTTYGAQVVTHILEGLRGYNIGIVSGMAIGIDGLAHEAALNAGLYTLAIPGSGLGDSVLYPARHKRLARRILESGGGLLSEYDATQVATNWSFPQRNRLVTGISRATLLIEAGEKSGTLITAKLCVDYNRDLMIVPGSIFSKNSLGVHQFLKLGATPVTNPADIISYFNLEPQLTTQDMSSLSNQEQQIISLLATPLCLDEIVRQVPFETAQVVSLIMHMELKGLLIESQGYYRAVI